MLKDLPFVVGDINAGRRCSREIETSGASERSRVLFLDFFRDRVVRLGVIETDVRWGVSIGWYSRFPVRRIANSLTMICLGYR